MVHECVDAPGIRVLRDLNRILHRLSRHPLMGQSEEECHRTVRADGYYVILPMLPEVCGGRIGATALTAEYSSADDLMDRPGVTALLHRHGFLDAAVSAEAVGQIR